jgi:protein TonB
VTTDRLEIDTRRRIAVAGAALAHGALLAALLVRNMWHVDELADGRSVRVSLVVVAPAAGGSRATTAAHATIPTPRRPRPRPRVLEQPAQVPGPVAEATAKDPPEIARNSPAADDVVGGHEGEGNGSDDGTGSGAGAGAGRSMNEALRRSLIQRYLDGVLRPRISARFTYPHEAARRNLEGDVVVRIAISSSGSLLVARVAGPCPAVLLCEAAVDVIRRAAPFAAPPIELESPVEIEVPLSYKLD